MKISPILAQYLYSHKRLDLPGIGTFLLDGSAEISAEGARQAKPALLEGVSFEPDSSIKDSPELISYISSQTGKIKALATADLESHLELAKQFLNIGKPYLFEGIGTLSRIKGEYTFAPGYTIYEPARDTSARGTASASSHQQEPTNYKDVLFNKKKETPWKKPLVLLLIVAGLGLAIWGGYKVYNNSNEGKKKIADTVLTEQPSLPNNDTPNTDNTNSSVQLPQPQDTAKQVTPPAVQALPPLAAGMWKFVVETAGKERALKRFSKLQTIGVKSVQMETKDSVTFRIYFALPASVADTAHIIDSLRRNYTPAGNRAYVEK